MMDRFSIAQDVANLLPTMRVVIVAAYNLQNSGTNAQVVKFAEVRSRFDCRQNNATSAESPIHNIKDTASSALSTLATYPNAQSHPRIALYRNTLKERCNVPSKKFPQSNESLYRRLMKEQKPLRSLNPVVDFYNAVSIKHAVTAGAFDLGELQTRSTAPLELRLSAAGDVFTALDAEAGAKPLDVGAGELVYAQDSTVLTRQLAWRQAAQCLVSEETQNVIFMSEIFEDEKDSGLAQAVADDLQNGLRDFFGVEGQVTILGHKEGILDVKVHNAFF